LKLGLSITGAFLPEHWQQKSVSSDFFALKGTVEQLLERLGVSKVLFRETELPWCQPGQTAQVLVGGERAGWLGRIHSETLEAYDLSSVVFAGELDVDTLLPYVSLSSEYSPLPRYPALLRDMAVIVPEHVTADRVTALIAEAGGPWVEAVALFDLYRGPQVPAEYRSLAFAITYRDEQRTLSDEDACKLHNRIEQALEEKLGALLRK
jgi:phenylalanyl-tRNA synthetase beta chain